MLAQAFLQRLVSCGALLALLSFTHSLHSLSFSSFGGATYFTSVCSFSHWHNIIFRYWITDLTQAPSLDIADFTLVINLSLVLQMQHFILFVSFVVKIEEDFYLFCKSLKVVVHPS